MELAIPLVALGSLYVMNNQHKKPKESFRNVSNELPNTNIPNKNYPDEYPLVVPELEKTSKLSTVNSYDSQGAYTDKYFNPATSSQYASDTTMPSNAPVSGSYYSLTGEKVDSSYYTHNNMVPYFGGSIRSRNVDVNSNESVLDNTSGAGSQTIIKKEQSPLFAPSENYQWAHGAPNQTDFMQSRVNVGMRMANVKPFAEERVAPGLGLGYTTDGSNGFNSGMAMRDQWLPKTADQMRVNNKQKATGLMQFGYEGPAASQVKNIGSIGVMEKNRPDTYFNMGPERYMTTTGAAKGVTLQAIPVDRNVTRPETAMEYIGAAGYTNPAAYVPGEYMPSHNIELGAVPLAAAAAVGRNWAHEAEYGMKSTKAYNNNRTANNQNGGYFGAIGGAIGAVIAPVMDVIRPSRKENTVGNLRPYQNAKSTVSESYIFNPADRPGTTIRETTENSKFHLNVNAGQNGGAYQVSEQQAIQNARQTTGDFYYAGVVGAGADRRGARTYDAEYRQRNNDVKSSTIDGRLAAGNMSLMNGNINMRQAGRDSSLINNRAVAPMMPYQTPDIANMGRLSGNPGSSLYQNIQLDRNSPEVLSSLSGNPFALSVTKGV
uniref:DUF5899 domain-containing protein n=1 Tax=viral metagenome TaxID=1070528 RepID=A0A6C0K030_9ZZZZ